MYSKKNKTRQTSAKVTSTRSSIDLTQLSPELLCQILSSLPLREILCLSLLSRKLQAAVELYLGLCKNLHFAEGRLFGYLPVAITDKQLMILMTKCPRVEYIYGLNPRRIERRQLRGSTRIKLTISGVITALSICKHLKGVETSHLELMEAILYQLPQVKIVGHFRNHNGRFPVSSVSRLSLPSEPLLSSLHLTGIEIPELPSIPTINYLYLQWVRFSKVQPFHNFSAPALETFVMRHCVGPGNPLRFVPLAFALAAANNLARLELVGMAFLGRLLQRVAEDNIRRGSFRKLEKMIFGACRNVVETDVGYLMLASNTCVNDVCLQPSLSRDSLFLSLKMAESVFANMQSLHVGFVDDFPRKGQWSRADLLAFGLEDILELPAPVTDIGMKIAGPLFPMLTKLVIYNCPHLVKPTTWYSSPDDRSSWSRLQQLAVSYCHCLRLEDFLLFMAYLPSIETVVLENVFREPPKGCSYVGLSAGTGLGMSSAIVSNQQELIAVNGNAMEAVAAAHVGERDDLDDDDDDDDEDDDILNEDDDDDDDYNNAIMASKTKDSQHSADDDDDVKASSPMLASSSPTDASCKRCGLLLPKTSTFRNDPANPQPSSSKVCFCPVPLQDEDTFDKSCASSSSCTVMTATGRKQSKRHQDPENVERGCGATVEDIKQAMRTASSSSSMTSNKQNDWQTVMDGRASRFKSCGKCGTGEHRRRPPLHRAPKTLEKACGTSDPILEDDYEQNLKVMSDTLHSLTVISCGISDICLRHCPKLEHLEVESCRILRRIRLRKCPLLTKVSISQCPKLDVVSVTKDMGRLPAKRNRILFLQPISTGSTNDDDSPVKHAIALPTFDPVAVERTALQSSLSCYNVCVAWDEGTTRDFRLIHRQIVYSWLNIVNKINTKLIGDHTFSKGSSIVCPKQKEYPWGRNVYRIQGDLQDGRFEICADLPWIRTLWNAPCTLAASNLHPSSGLYRPERRGHTSSDVCIDLLGDSIFEQRENSHRLALYSFAVYMHLCRGESP